MQVHAHLHIQEKDAGVYFFFVYTARPRILQKPCNLVGGLTRERINDLCPTIVGKGKEGKEKVCVCERERRRREPMMPPVNVDSVERIITSFLEVRRLCDPVLHHCAL